MNIVAGLLPYDEGTVSIDGKQSYGTRALIALLFSNTPACFPGAPSPATSVTAWKCRRRFDAGHHACRAPTTL